MPRIHYAVIALTKTEAGQVIGALRSQHRQNLATWLTDNKDRVYGDIPDDWKPFSGQNIAILIDNSDFVSETLLISNLGEDFAGLPVLLRSVEVYFIDIFALFLGKYEELAKRLDAALGAAGKCKCCFLIYYGLSKDIQDELEREYRNKWPVVCDAYKRGCLHRIAVRADDLMNFRNHLVNVSIE